MSTMARFALYAAAHKPPPSSPLPARMRTPVEDISNIAKISTESIRS